MAMDSVTGKVPTRVPHCTTDCSARSGSSSSSSTRDSKIRISAGIDKEADTHIFPENLFQMDGRSGSALELI